MSENTSTSERQYTVEELEDLHADRDYYLGDNPPIEGYSFNSKEELDEYKQAVIREATANASEEAGREKSDLMRVVSRTINGELNKHPDPFGDKEIRTALINVKKKIIKKLECG